jgi:hypothetical protein
MKKLSSLTRTENCFFTVDNHALKNIQDLLDYLASCDEESFRHHVNGQKNDFADWIEKTLLFQELANSFRSINTSDDMRNAIINFFKTFDYKSKEVPEEKMFHTVDDYGLKNIQELYYYLINCDDNSFRFHLNEQKNDFANWVGDVLLFPELAAKMRTVYGKNESILTLKDFFVKDASNGTNPEYEKYLDERTIKGVDDKKIDDKNVEDKKIIDDNGLKDEEKINLDMKLNLKNDEDAEEDKDSQMGLEGLKQFSDDDLEKFTRFVKSENLVETDAKVEYLRAALQELKNIIKDLRRADKDPLIADLMLRTISAKIDYYAVSKNPEEYAYIIKQMKDAQHEMEECAVQQTYNIAEEILKDLKLQGIAMKKSQQ